MKAAQNAIIHKHESPNSNTNKPTKSTIFLEGKIIKIVVNSAVSASNIKYFVLQSYYLF